MTNPFHPYTPNQRKDTSQTPVDHPSHPNLSYGPSVNDTPGLRQRKSELRTARMAEMDLYGSHPVADLLMGPATPEVEVAQRAYQRQARVAENKPAVSGSDRPSEIRAKAKKKYGGKY